MQTFRLEKGSALTFQEGDDNLRYPHLWDITKTFSTDMVVFDGSDFYYLCIQDVTTPNTIPLNDVSYWKKLSQTQTLNLDDLGDVVITTPTVGQGLRFDGVKWVNDDGSLSIIDVTHSQLSALISGNNIVPGVYYRMEYTNVHAIDGTGDINNGSLERLLLLGITNNKISKSAFSESFPNDTIYYDVSNVLAEDGITARPGFIERRISNDNKISTPFDFRNTKVRRYKQNNPLWTPTTSYNVKDVVVNSNVVYGCVKTHTSSASFITDKVEYWVKLFNLTGTPWNDYVIPGSIAVFPNGDLGGFNFQYNTGLYNDYLVFQDLANTYNVEISDSVGFDALNKLGDVLIGNNVKNLIIQSGSAGITIGNYCSGVNIGIDSKLVYLDVNSTNVEIVNSSEIIIGAYSNNNKVLGYSTGVTISEYTEYNEFNSVLDCACGEGSKQNKINVSLNIYCLQYSENNEIMQTSEAILKESTKKTTIQNSSSVTTGYSCWRNDVIDCDTVTLGEQCSFNKLLGSDNVVLGNSCDNNEIIKSNNTTIGNTSNFNKITESNNSTLGNNVDECELRTGSDGSNIGNGCVLVYLRTCGAIAIPINSRNINISDVGSVTFSDLNSACEAITISDGTSFTIGSACKFIEIEDASGLTTIGASCSNIKIEYSGLLDIGSGCRHVQILSSSSFTILTNNKNVKIYNSTNFTIGNSNETVVIENSSSISLGDSNIDFRAANCAAFSVGNGNKAVAVADCQNCTLGNTNTNVVFKGSNSGSSVLNNCSDITSDGNVNCIISSNCIGILIKNSIAVSVPPNANNVDFVACNTISYSGTPTISSCYFRGFRDSSIQANLVNVVINQVVRNKTITAPFNDVVFNALSVNVEVLSVAKSSLCFNSTSPNGQVWAVTSDNLGNITNVSLS